MVPGGALPGVALHRGSAWELPVRRARRAREGTCHTHGDVWLVSFSRDGTGRSARSLWVMSLHHEDSVRSDCAVVCFTVAVFSVH